MRLTHRSSRFADRAGLIVISAQTVADIETSAAWLDGRLGARLAVRNVTDATQFDAVGLPLPGRAFYASAEAWWW